MKSKRAAIYIGVISAAGAVILADGLLHWSTHDWMRYALYAAIALIASGMKVSLPSVMGTMSMNFVFVLIGISELSRPETLAVGCLGMLVQCTFHAKVRLRAVQVVFSVASMACSIAAAWSVYHLPGEVMTPVQAQLMLFAAACTFFVANTLSVSAVIALTEGKRTLQVWRSSYLWSFPNYLVGAAMAWVISLATRTFGWQSALFLVPVIYVVYRSHRHFVERLEESNRRFEQQRIHAEEVTALHRRTIEVLAMAIEAKDQTTHDHLQRVEVYALAVGQELGLSESELEALRAAALLHDIGKLAVPEYIISKPGKLTPEEFEKMKIHPVVGAEMVESVKFPYPVAPIVRSHHEKWDGSGYPDGLSGDQIPIGARILSAVDCLDALASDRQYRRALPLEEAIKVVQAQAGVSFDPKVVAILARRYIELERQAKGGAPAQKQRLSTDVKIERGSAPAAGFESSSGPAGSGEDLVRFHRSISGPDSAARVLAGLTQALEKCDGQAAAFATLRQRLPRLVPFASLVIYRLQENTVTPEFVAGENSAVFSSMRIPLGQGLSGWVAENRKTIVNGNPSVDPGYRDDPESGVTLRSALAVPIEASGAVLGVLALYREERDAFNSDHLSVLVSLSASLARALVRALESEQTRYHGR